MARATDTVLAGFYEYSPLPISEETLERALEIIRNKYKAVPLGPLENENTFVGVEIEMENVPESVRCSLPFTIYEAKTDGSLRNNGMEFITRPTLARALPQYLSVLKQDVLKVNPEPSFSERTSVHVHVNARDMSIPAIMNTLLLYITVERLLYRYVKSVSGVDRANNIFCLPLNKADQLPTLGRALNDVRRYRKVDDIYRMRESFGSFVSEWHKYLGINFLRATDRKCGTIEYRHFAGTLDTEVIATWVALLLKLRTYAKKVELENLISTIQELNTTSAYEAFLSSVFQELYPLIYCKNYAKHLEENVSFIKSCVVYQEVNEYTKALKETSIEVFKQSAMYKALMANGVKFLKTTTKKAANPRKRPSIGE